MSAVFASDADLVIREVVQRVGGEGEMPVALVVLVAGMRLLVPMIKVPNE